LHDRDRPHVRGDGWDADQHEQHCVDPDLLGDRGSVPDDSAEDRHAEHADRQQPHRVDARREPSDDHAAQHAANGLHAADQTDLAALPVQIVDDERQEQHQEHALGDAAQQHRTTECPTPSS
jgi:hypothetical protein